MTNPDTDRLDRIEELALALASKDALINAFFDLGVDLFAVADMETGTFIQVNQAWERVTGWTAHELTSKPFVSFVHPEDHEATDAEYQELKRDGTSHSNFKNRYMCRDGSLVSLAWRTSEPINGVVYASARVIESQDEVKNRLDRIKINRHIVRSCAESLGDAIEQAQLVKDRLDGVYDIMRAESA